MSHSVRVFSSREAIVQSLATILIKDLDRIESDHYYTIAFSGGSIMEYLFSYLSDNYADLIDWEKLLVFWIDERCVPPEDNESNFGMAYDSLLQNVPIPDGNIFRIKGEDEPAAEAKQYSGLVSSIVPDYKGVPQFDMILSGLDIDGHTASIFPDRPDLYTTGKLFDVVEEPGSGSIMITATIRLINNAAKIFFIVTGKEKASIISEIIEGKEGWEDYPASKVNARSGHLLWMLDTEAASLLKTQYY